MINEINNLITPQLTRNDVKIYIALIENGESTAGFLSEITHIKRPTVYLTLRSLHEKGFVSIVEKSKIKKYAAQDPENLREFFAQKIRALNQILPRLKWLPNRLSNKPNVRYFHGIEGARSAYSETLEERNSMIKSIGSIEGANKILGEHWTKQYIKKRVDKKIRMRSILTKTKFTQELIANNRKHLRESLLINSKKLPDNVELNIFNHKISFACYGKEPLGIIIENKELTEILNTLYDFAWKNNDKNG
ncbi:MAG: transcriptional regulator TrmB [Candidatus Berkelbacteria bacterium Licking1014_7]|uniref:Transcriptional regulator TrmB n=1 Tax=Candidatus Berkelbacteria bacterium Licking1014_7 TaxID=2017147 RepID=A0A554LHQ0_9BACT|nr:MAG: transcriptional regulator TrmB [Candidatus Berkelbacteria bacterium Licking1014_7]